MKVLSCVFVVAAIICAIAVLVGTRVPNRGPEVALASAYAGNAKCQAILMASPSFDNASNAYVYTCGLTNYSSITVWYENGKYIVVVGY